MHFPLIITYVIYFAIILAIGFVASRATKNLSDYVLGGRSLSGPIAALGAGASDMSSWLLLALPGAVFLYGVSEIWLPIGLSLGAYINWVFIAKRLRVYTEIANDSLTIPAYLENRFHDTSGILRAITALTILFFFTFYASAGFVGGAILFQSTFDLSYTSAMWISASFLIIYTSVGGFLAVNWVDFLQGTLMLVALIAVPLVTLNQLGGWDATINSMQTLSINYDKFTSNISGIEIASLLAWGLAYFGQPHILVRFMAARNKNVIPLARRICMSWMLLAMLAAIATGLIGSLYFTVDPNRTLLNPETVFISLAKLLFHPWLIGILMAAVLSAIMSTLAAQLLASSSALTEDIYHRFGRRNASQKELVWMSRLTVVLIALAAIVIAYNPSSTILKMVEYAWGGLGASFGAVIVFSLFWPRMTRNGAIAGIVFGAVGIIAWEQVEGGLFDLYELIPAFLLSSLGIVVVSLLDKLPSAAIHAEYQRFLKELKD